MLDAFAKMKDGQAMLVPTPNGAQVIVLAGSRMAPVAAEQAKPAIEQFLLNERKRQIIDKDRKDMRAGNLTIANGLVWQHGRTCSSCC